MEPQQIQKIWEAFKNNTDDDAVTSAILTLAYVISNQEPEITSDYKPNFK